MLGYMRIVYILLLEDQRRTLMVEELGLELTVLVTLMSAFVRRFCDI